MTGHLLGARRRHRERHQRQDDPDPDASPPTINLRSRIRNAISTTCRTSRARAEDLAMLSNNLGFGGQNAALFSKAV
ncbi:MAG: hypothetical protein QM765_11470 [Myxococcales bacterium]